MFATGTDNVEALQREVDECAKNLDIDRGRFQIAAVLRREVSGVVHPREFHINSIPIDSMS